MHVSGWMVQHGCRSEERCGVGLQADMDRFGEDDVESFLSHEEADPRESLFGSSKRSPAGHSMDVSKGEWVFGSSGGKLGRCFSGSVVVFQGLGFAIRQAEVLTGGGGETGFSFNEVTCLRASTSKVVCCHFSSDGKLLASAGHDKRVSMRSPCLYVAGRGWEC